MNLSLLISVLMAVESNNDPAAIGDHGRAVGILQIHPGVVADVNRIQDKTYILTDRLDPTASREMATIYLVHYMIAVRNKTGELPSYELAARLWNGGYHGYLAHKESTDNYWKKVKVKLEKER